MPQLVKGNDVLFEAPTRSECLVVAFERRLVYDYGRKRNSLLPGVKVLGEDIVATTYKSPGKIAREE